MTHEDPAHFAPFLELLAEEGFRPHVEAAVESIRFKFEGVDHLLVPDPRDPSFLHIVLSYDAPTASAETLLAQANSLNAEWKAVKVVLVPESSTLEFHFEAFFDGQLSAASLLQRALPCLRGAAARFFSAPVMEQPLAGAVRALVN